MRVVALGFACNNACIFCAQGDLRSRGAEIDEAPIAAELASIQPGEIVAFVGGEPTLAARLPDWIEEASRRGAARVVVQTNGRRLAYRAYARELASVGKSGAHSGGPTCVALDVSLHGSSER